MALVINDRTVQHMAHLARLNFSNDQLPYFTNQVKNSIAMCKTLDKVDTTGITPTFNVLDQLNVTRKDKPEKWHERDALLKNAPDVDNNYIKVPKK